MPFAPVHFTTGPVVPTWGGFQLGYNEDGVRVQLDVKLEDIFSDDMGGRGGVPSDSQFLGARGFVNMDYTKYNKTYMDNLSCQSVAAMTSGAKGLLPAIGSFARQDNLGGALTLNGPNENLSFAFAKLGANYEFNSGTVYRRYRLMFEVWMNQTDYTQLTTALQRRLFTMS